MDTRNLSFNYCPFPIPALHQDAFFFLVCDGFTSSNSNPDSTTEANWWELGWLNFDYSHITFR